MNNTVSRNRSLIVAAVALLAVIAPRISSAAVMNDYCIVPSFLAQSITPNLLMMIDNSSSMYDLQYVDKGKKHCSVSTTKSCFFDSDCNHCSTSTGTACTTNADCPSPQSCVTSETCSVFDRNPFYCYDETFSSANTYVGYFDPARIYTYRTATSDFAEAVFPASCTAGSVDNSAFSIPSHLCLEYVTGTRDLVRFFASGKYLNWLTASKLDVEKQILTGGKFDGSHLLAESRGCVGQGFIKNANTSDFINYANTDTNPNTPLKVTFSVRGPDNPRNPAAPSFGGQTYINLYAGKVYDFGDCQAAITSIATGGNADIKTDVDACLAATDPVSGTCQQLASKACTTSTDCVRNPGQPQTSFVCTVDTARTCTGATDAVSCQQAARNACTGLATRACTVDTDCAITTAETLGTCSVNSYTPVLPRTGSGNLKVTVPSSCRTNANCSIVDTQGSNTTTYTGTCTGYIAPTSSDYGPCVITPAKDFGPCTANYVGGCTLPANAAEVKTKVSFSQSMQACWSLREGHAIGTDELNTVKNQCADIYSSFWTCSNDHLQTCTVANAATVCGAGNSCVNGPPAIGAGNPGLLCGESYEGAFYSQSGTVWNLGSSLPSPRPSVCAATDSVSDCMIKVHTKFCNDFNTPNVTDPTDAPSDTTISDNLPAILSGIGVEGQLGKPLNPPLRVQLAASEPTSGIVQEFRSRIRMGMMTFNFAGSLAEAKVCSNDSTIKCATDADCGAGTCTGILPAPKVCSGNPYRVCQTALDCETSGETCALSTQNADGGKVMHYVGLGKCYKPCGTNSDCPLSTCNASLHCASSSQTVCTTDNNCPSGETCVTDGVGNYSSGLIKEINDVKAWAWTPFAEAFYDAIGYFAQQSAKRCSVTAGTACTVNTDCPSGETCIVQPAKVCSGSNAACSTAADCIAGQKCIYKSRTDMRLNTGDFDETLNPSQFRCQKNNLLLISDGMSTGDRNSSVTGLATLYATQTGGQSGWTTLQCSISGTACTTNADCKGGSQPAGQTCDTFPKYGGSMNLDNLSWIARHRQIGSLAIPPATSASTTTPKEARDSVATYIVFNGASNGEPGERNSETLLQQTAANGGTVFRKAEGDPALLRDAIRKSFEDVAASAASGTAASILSNSEGSGANILQAVFFPKKIFDNSTEANWIGEMQNFWYYIDPFIGNSSVREDTDYTATNLANGDPHTLDLKQDYALQFFFDNTDPNSATYNQTMVKKFQDTDGNGSGDLLVGSPVSPDSVRSIWRAGRLLWSRSASSRSIYTPCSSGCLTDGSYNPTDTKLMSFSTANESSLRSYLQGADAAEGTDIINYTRGVDVAGYRPRTVTIGTSSYVWKLGDIISSTPRLQSSVKLNGYDMTPPVGYNDVSYSAFSGKSPYQHRGMVYVGANDGMLHAFKLGSLAVTPSGTTKATLSGTNLGEEEWAFVPTNVLPYLKYIGDTNYGHLYSMDGTSAIIDASIAMPATCTAGNYWDCDVDKTNGTNWRTVLVGGMGIGGASKNSTDTCTEDSSGTCVKTPISGVGYSSIYALDITNQYFDSSDSLAAMPKLLWEFSDASITDTTKQGIGFSTSGVATVRVSPRDGTNQPVKDKNGRWFAVFGSGPTGPIDKTKHQFLGKSDQPVKIYVVDLNATPPFVLNTNYWVIDTLVDGTKIWDGYVSTMSGSSIDADRWNKSALGNYQDDALYFGYTQSSTSTTATASNITAASTWNAGGILRLITQEDPNPANWRLSKVFDGMGPITTAIARLQDRKAHKLWLYFGEGRYFFAQDDMAPANMRHIAALQEPCYTANDTIDPTCTTKKRPSDLTDQTDISTAATTISNSGWYITLDGPDNLKSLGGERLITDPVAMTNGAVFYTTFKPTSDICNFGGNSYLWAARYDTGLAPPQDAIKGKALVQVSTGEFKEIDLATAFTASGGRKMATPMTGKPPSDPPPIVSKSNLKPVKRVLHIQEH